ncbi:DUF3320 domain-containing protein [Kiloniella spongiae]|uniref:DUF3320 domain-containing protein n=1 Tax=Kiloniella spongiae TaxID=1489064 RepID=UPI00069B4435|nr:DUF3320 domain-containing protein [Kiloniella spongiae]
MKTTLEEENNTSNSDSEFLEYSNLNTRAALEKLRQNLLDVGTRNRLISAPFKNARANALEIVDELSDEIFRLLWTEGKSFTFLSNPDEKNEKTQQQNDDSQPVYIPPEEEIIKDKTGLAARHIDTKLQTRLYKETLQKRLIALSRDSNLFEEEQGVNILFLGIGFLKWFDSRSSDIERFAPLILLPISLQRDQVRSRFKLKKRDEDIEVNLSLRAKLNEDFDISLPDFPANEDWTPSDYFSLVSKAITQKDQWSVEPDRILLGFYSFSKFLLYRDLDASEWPSDADITKNNLISSLLVDGFGEKALNIFENQNLDDILAPQDLGHVKDADSSQAEVIKLAAEGNNLVVQGPPGTGKSQSIANVIAAATRKGKSVLFVAEKMAALDVVYHRLQETGLGPLCLELHSRKANKKAVIEEIKRTLELGQVSGGAEDTATQTKIVRDKLNEISKLLHSPMDEVRETPFRVLSELVWLREEGLEPSEFKVGDKLLSGPEQHNTALAALQKLCDRISSTGPSNQHDWRGVRNRLTPMDVDRLKPKIQDLVKFSARLEESFVQANRVVKFDDEASIETAKSLIEWLTILETMPDGASNILSSASIRENTARALELLSAANNLRAKYDAAIISVKEIALDQDWSEARQLIATYGKSLFRFFNGEFKKSIALLNSYSTEDPAKKHEDRLAQIDKFIEYQNAFKRLEKEETQAKAFFNDLWRGRLTETSAPQAVIEWYQEHKPKLATHSDLMEVLNNCPNSVRLNELSSELNKAIQAFEKCWLEICTMLDLDLTQAFSNNGSVAIREINEKLSNWQANFERLDEWFLLRAEEEHCREVGLSDFVESLSCGDLTTTDAVNDYRYARAEALWKLMIDKNSALLDIDGDDRTQLINRFQTLELELFRATAHEIAAKHTAGIPTGAQGQMGIIRGEAGKRRNHRSIRRLVEDAGDALQQIKPVFLMSPISVAQYLPPGRINFDLVLIDEASQVRPEDSIGAIARGRSTIVVGDSKQLPPTSFFARTLGDIGQEDENDEENVDQPGVHAGAMESILTLCAARGMTSKTLQWHYRSKHPSLIQVSNDTFYENKLKFPPSPQIAGREGLIFREVDGIYDRGKTRTNKIEAQEVAKAVLKHAKTAPRLSLGVVTLSTAQRNMIEGELELLRAENQDVEYFFSKERHEPFFVKNLENVQGDERDVIFISVCYAKDKDGYMSQSFGPVNSLGGERRLNVLFTRAKRRCEIFASITDQDIELRTANVPAGRRALHAYLKFARTGTTDVPEPSGKEPDSLFEEAVMNKLRAAGYTVDPQVGSAGFYIDMAIRNPENMDVYLLGVECDGATYHSAAWARERDRLRQNVLEAKGWLLHRIWSTDWFQRPEQEFQKLLQAIDKARIIQENNQKAEEEVIREQEESIIKRELLSPDEPKVSIPYVEAKLDPINGYNEPHLVPVYKLAELVKLIVEIEQPIHKDEIARKVSKAWGLQKAGARIKKLVTNAIILAKKNKTIIGEDFLTSDNDKSIMVRDRTNVESSSLRKAQYLPPDEVDLAIHESVTRNVAATADDLARDVAKAFGFKSTSAQLKTSILERINTQVSQGTLEDFNGQIAKSDQSNTS